MADAIPSIATDEEVKDIKKKNAKEVPVVKVKETTPQTDITSVGTVTLPDGTIRTNY